VQIPGVIPSPAKVGSYEVTLEGNIGTAAASKGKKARLGESVGVHHQLSVLEFQLHVSRKETQKGQRQKGRKKKGVGGKEILPARCPSFM